MLLFDPEIEERTDPRPVNPMYLFGGIEKTVLLHFLVPSSFQRKKSIFLDMIDFSFKDKKSETFSNTVLRLDDIRAQKVNKVILMAGFTTTMRTPHHIHEDGNYEEQPGRDGPMRTYFDGSSINDLGHAIALCIDNEKGLITTQCPRGYDFPPHAEELLKKFFPAYDRVTLRHAQQTDVHSCAPITIFNMCAFAGVVKPAERIDILEWRKYLTTVLDWAEMDISSSSVSSDTKKLVTEARYKGMFDPKAPIHKRRYIGPAYSPIQP